MADMWWIGEGTEGDWMDDNNWSGTVDLINCTIFLDKPPHCPHCGWVVPNPNHHRWIKFDCPNCAAPIERWKDAGFNNNDFKPQGYKKPKRVAVEEDRNPLEYMELA